MTTEQKALALVNAAKQDSERTIPPFACGLPTMYKALLAAIEAHEADKKAFSDAVVHCRRCSDAEAWTRIKFELEPFILPEPEPDPLVEALRDANAGPYYETNEACADAVRQALAARGYKIVPKESDNG